MRPGWIVIALALMVGSLMSPPEVEAQVKWKTGADGRRVMYNEGRPRTRASSVARRPAAASAASPVETIDVGALVEQYASQYAVDPALVHAVIRVESAYNAGAVSHKGAIGLMQLMPQTARELAVDDPFDPAENVRGGTHYLRQMLDRFDNRLEWALAGYNAGPGAVERYEGIPPYTETINYVEKVIRLYRGDEGFSLPRTIPRYRGRKTYLVREGGRLVMTTTRPKSP